MFNPGGPQGIRQNKLQNGSCEMSVLLWDDYAGRLSQNALLGIWVRLWHFFCKLDYVTRWLLFWLHRHAQNECCWIGVRHFPVSLDKHGSCELSMSISRTYLHLGRMYLRDHWFLFEFQVPTTTYKSVFPMLFSDADSYAMLLRLLLCCEY